MAQGDHFDRLRRFLNRLKQKKVWVFGDDDRLKHGRNCQVSRADLWLYLGLYRPVTRFGPLGETMPVGPIFWLDESTALVAVSLVGGPWIYLVWPNDKGYVVRPLSLDERTALDQCNAWVLRSRFPLD
ncbi:MAG: hypothetical protein K2V38_15995 [Gemmataceae bacterium]|nr:hypothetical protein [Gemmataceae bacterium]